MHDSVDHIRDRIIEAALPLVVFDGWRWEVIEQAASEAGYAPDMAHAVFPSRLMDVMAGLSAMADRAMLTALAPLDPEQMRVRDRVRAALMARYEFLQPHKEAMREALSYMAHPLRKPCAAKMVWATADQIWDWAGDTASDYNRYTKRGLLSGIIVSSTLVWLNDDSADMAALGAFIDRRIENAMQIGKLMGRFKKRGAGNA